MADWRLPCDSLAVEDAKRFEATEPSAVRLSRQKISVFARLGRSLVELSGAHVRARLRT